MALPVEDTRVRMAFGAIIAFWVVARLSWGAGLIWFSAAVLRPGITVANYLYGILIALSLVMFIDDSRTWRLCLLSLAAGTAVVSFFSVLVLLGVGPEWAVAPAGHRITCTFPRVNQLHSYMVPGMVFL